MHMREILKIISMLGMRHYELANARGGQINVAVTRNLSGLVCPTTQPFHNKNVLHNWVGELAHICVEGKFCHLRA